MVALAALLGVEIESWCSLNAATLSRLDMKRAAPQESRGGPINYSDAD
jgi:hypothetical protein